MGESKLNGLVRAADAYEALFVPALFEQWAPQVVDAARIRPGQTVLDVACGTGILARAALARVGSGGRVTGIDPGPGMLAVARRLAPAVTWHEGLAESLPFASHSFDAVVSQFGLMFFSDRPQALREMVRVRAPDGCLAVAVWDSLARIPAYAAVVDLLEQTAGRAAADALRAPFVLGDPQALRDLFAAAGIASTQITTLAGTGRFPSVRTMVEADLRGWLPIAGVELTEELIGNVLAQAERTLAPFAQPDGRVVFDLSAHLITAH